MVFDLQGIAKKGDSKTLPTDLRSISLDDYEGNLHL